MSNDILVGPIRVRIIQKKKRFLRKPIKEYIHLELEVTANDIIKIRKVKGNAEEVHADIKRGFGISGAGISISNLDENAVIIGNYSAHSGPLDMWVRGLTSTTSEVEKC